MYCCINVYMSCEEGDIIFLFLKIDLTILYEPFDLWYMSDILWQSADNKFLIELIWSYI